MIRPFLFATVGLVLLGCGPGSPTRAREISDVLASELAAVYRQSWKDSTYLDCRVRVRIEANQYKLVGDRIETHFVTDGKPGCVYFFCDSLPQNASRQLIVTGTCRGIVRDGIIREPGVDYYVKVDGCSVIVTDLP